MTNKTPGHTVSNIIRFTTKYKTWMHLPLQVEAPVVDLVKNKIQRQTWNPFALRNPIFIAIEDEMKSKME